MHNLTKHQVVSYLCDIKGYDLVDFELLTATEISSAYLPRDKDLIACAAYHGLELILNATINESAIPNSQAIRVDIPAIKQHKSEKVGPLVLAF